MNEVTYKAHIEWVNATKWDGLTGYTGSFQLSWYRCFVTDVKNADMPMKRYVKEKVGTSTHYGNFLPQQQVNLCNQQGEVLLTAIIDFDFSEVVL